MEDYQYHYVGYDDVGSRLNGTWCVFTWDEYLRDLKIFYKLFFSKFFKKRFFPLIDLEQNGKWFQMVPPENIKLALNILFVVCLFGFVVNVLMMFFVAI